MKYLISIMPINAGGMKAALSSEYPCDQKFENAKQLIGWAAKDGSYYDRSRMREYAFMLDENAAELLNTSHIIFVGYSEAQRGFCSVSVGRTVLYGPLLACTRKYAGFEKIGAAIPCIEYILSSSMGELDVGKVKSLAEMMKEYGSKS